MVNGIGGFEGSMEAYRTSRLAKRSSLFSIDMRTMAGSAEGSAQGAQTPVPAAAVSRILAAPAAVRQDSAAGLAALPVYAWREDVTALTDMDDGSIRTDAVNPKQFATDETAQALANQLGLKNFGLNLAGFTRYTADVQMLNTSGSALDPALNAGLVADTFARYGSGPGTYGQYLIDRDLAMLRGETIPDPYASR
jgi:hypothetical protein